MLNFVNLNNSVIDSNAASSSSSNSGDVKYGGGGAYVADKAILTATDTSFTNNKATGAAASGGAIFVAKGGTANVIALNKWREQCNSQCGRYFKSEFCSRKEYCI